jgi:hypothetical protein
MTAPWATIPSLIRKAAAASVAAVVPAATTPAPVQNDYPADFVSNLESDPTGAAGGTPQLVTEQRLSTFLGDIVIGASTVKNIDISGLLSRCVGFQMINVVGTVQVNINGGGYRTVLSDFTLDESNISQLSVSTGAASGCIIQLIGV